MYFFHTASDIFLPCIFYILLACKNFSYMSVRRKCRFFKSNTLIQNHGFILILLNILTCMRQKSGYLQELLLWCSRCNWKKKCYIWRTKDSGCRLQQINVQKKELCLFYIDFLITTWWLPLQTHYIGLFLEGWRSITWEKKSIFGSYWHLAQQS